MATAAVVSKDPPHGTVVKVQNFDASNSTPKWLASARKDLGIREWTGDIHTPNPVVQQYVCKAMHNEHLIDVTDQPWCAYYIGAKLEDAGYPSSRSGMARSYLPYGVKIDKNDDTKWKAGDIVVFWRGTRNDGVTGHVAFLISWNASSVTVLGGNQGDMVSIIKCSRTKILGLSRPRSILLSRTAISSVGSAASTGANKAIGATVPDASSVATPAHADTLSSSFSSMPVDAHTLAPTTITDKLPSPDDLQAAYDQAHPYLSMLQSIKPELMIVLTLLSVGLAIYAGYYRWRDYKEGFNT